MIFIEKFNPEHCRTVSMDCFYRDRPIAELTSFSTFVSLLNEVFPDYKSLQENLKDKFFCIDDRDSKPMVKMFHTRKEAVAEAKKRLNDELSGLAAQMKVIIKQLEDVDKQGGEQE